MSFFFFSSRRRHTRWTGDWSSDVCSSDLLELDRDAHQAAGVDGVVGRVGQLALVDLVAGGLVGQLVVRGAGDDLELELGEIGRASCRGRVWMSGGAVVLKKKIGRYEGGGD